MAGGFTDEGFAARVWNGSSRNWHRQAANWFLTSRQARPTSAALWLGMSLMSARSI
jgi:hypothetical protein